MIATVLSPRIESLDRAEVLRYLGYSGQPIDDAMRSRIDEVVASCLVVGSPRAVTRTFAIAGRDVTDEGVPRVLLEGTPLTLDGHSMEGHLAGAVGVGLMAVTAGMGVDRELRRLSLTDRVAELLLDAAGTTLVERAADATEASLIAEAAQRGLFTNWRFSPGYGDLPLATQPQFLETLNAQRLLGITLSSTLLMTPTKSVTAVVGLFEEPQAGTRPTCSGCAHFDFCTLRETGRTCRGR